MTHDFLSIYPAKGFEYLLAIGYLLLFIPFWRFVQGGRHAAADRRPKAREQSGEQQASSRLVPAEVPADERFVRVVRFQHGARVSIPRSFGARPTGGRRCG